MTAPRRSRPPAARRDSSPLLYYLLSGVFLALTLGACGYLTLLFFDPQSVLNPIPPHTRTPIPTPTLPPTTTPVTPPTLPPQWTPTPEGGAPPSPTDIIIATLDAGTPIESPANTPTLTAGGAPTATPAPPSPTSPGGGYPAAPTGTAPPGGYP
jgi:hypothetical protein